MRSPLVPIFFIVAVDVLAFTLIVPLLPFYAEHFGATPREVGYLVSTFALCQLLAGPVLGDLSDRYGRKPVLALSQLGTFAGFVVLGTANSLAMVFASRILDGVTAGNLSVAQAAIVDVTPPEKRAQGFAVIGIAFGMGFLVGPALSAWLATIDLRLPIAFAAGLSLLSVVLTVLMLPAKTVVTPAPEGSYRGERAPAPPKQRRLGLLDWGSYRSYLARPALASRLAQYVLFSLSFITFTSGLALYAERRFVTDAGRPYGVREVGFMFAYAGVLGLLLQGGLVGRLVARFGEAAMVRFGFLLQGVGFAMLAWAHSLPLLIVASTISSIGNAPLRPALTSLITRRVSADEQGLVLGLSQSLNALAQIVAPLLAGLLIARGSLSAWALSAGAFALLALAVPTRDDERAASATAAA